MTRAVYCDPDHVYRFMDNGAPAGPSVTQILSDYIDVECGMFTYKLDTWTGRMIPKSTMDYAADYGKAIHAACAIMLIGELDWSTVHEDYVTPLKAFEVWLTENPRIKSNLLFVEQAMFSTKYGYAGTPDFGHKAHRNMAIVDIKTGIKRKTHGAQTSAYAELARPGKADKVERYGLYLPKTGDGKAELVRYNSPTDWRYFTACMDRRNYLEG